MKRYGRTRQAEHHPGGSEFRIRNQREIERERDAYKSKEARKSNSGKSKQNKMYTQANRLVMNDKDLPVKQHCFRLTGVFTLNVSDCNDRVSTKLEGKICFLLS